MKSLTGKFRAVRAGLALLSLVATGRSDPLDTWTWRNPLPTGNGLHGVVYGNGRFVAVGNAGTIVTSPDGTTWTVEPAAPGFFVNGLPWGMNGIAYGNNGFVAVGLPDILTSPDGITWTNISLGPSEWLSLVTYAKNEFVAFDGDSGTLFTSPDGGTWRPQPSPAGFYLRGVAFGNDLFVAVGLSNGPASAILSSPDSITWTSRAVTTNWITGIAYGNSQFVAIANEGIILTSPDGLSWTSRSLGTSPGDPSAKLKAIAYGNNQFVTVGGDGGAGAIWTSTDAIVWASRDSETHDELASVAYGAGRFVAVGGNSGSTIVSSEDAITWTNCTENAIPWNFGNNVVLSDPMLTTVTYGNNHFVGMANTGSILTSPDGLVWTSHDGMGAQNPAFGLGIAYGANVFVSFGWAGAIATSPDGITWTLRESGTNYALNGVSYCNNQFVAVGGAFPGPAVILTSPDGITWANRPAEITNQLWSIAYGENQFVAVGSSGTVATSSDGENWTARHSSAQQTLLAITFGNGRFVAVGSVTGPDNIYAAILTSPDGVKWTDSNLSGVASVVDPLASVSYGDGQFVAVGRFGLILTSPDGVAWTNRNSGTDNDLLGVIFEDHAFVAWGLDGTILQSGVLLPERPTLGLELRPDSPAVVTVSGSAGRTYSVEASSDLEQWLTITNITLTSSTWQFADPAAADAPRRFYRALSR
jgi:hypothetical protein